MKSKLFIGATTILGGILVLTISIGGAAFAAKKPIKGARHPPVPVVITVATPPLTWRDPCLERLCPRDGRPGIGEKGGEEDPGAEFEYKLPFRVVK